MRLDLKLAIADMARFPRVGRGILRIWKRNFKYFQLTLLVSLFWIVLEPCLYLLAVGKGVGFFVGDIQGESYLRFFFPALLATTSMFVSFFESTYGSYTRLVHQKTLKTVMFTPIMPSEIALGEIFWASFKGLMSSVGVILVCSIFGMKFGSGILPMILVLWLNAWIFAAFGLLMTSVVSHWDHLLYAQSGLLIPISLFSGTYFPLDEWPTWVQNLSLFSPLTHTVSLSRFLIKETYSPLVGMHIATLLLFAMLITNWAVSRIERKLYY